MHTRHFVQMCSAIERLWPNKSMGRSRGRPKVHRRDVMRRVPLCR
jgi:hypothetical protein